MKRAERMVFAARAMIGAPFRLHGRNPPTGLDCIGLALRVLEQAGHKRLGGGMIPAAYSVRGGTAEQFGTTMRAAGLRAVRRAKAGELAIAAEHGGRHAVTEFQPRPFLGCLAGAHLRPTADFGGSSCCRQTTCAAANAGQDRQAQT